MVSIRRTVLHVIAGLMFALLLASCGDSSPSVAADEPTDADGEPTPVLPAPTTSAERTTSAEPVEPAEDSTSTSDAATTTFPPTTAAPTTAAPTTTAPLEISSTPLESVALDLELIATLSQPVGLASRPGTDDLFVVEQAGRIVRLPNGGAEGADTTLDLRGTVSGGNEQGLLGLAFSPDGNELYVNFTDADGDTNVARYQMAGTVAAVDTVEVLMQIEQPRGNHNGGGLAFGPDGYLYIGMGDGGGGGDPLQHGQNTNTRHGAVLRIDVSSANAYAIPVDNPFTGGEAPEVFAWGIRNAWRFAFDSVTDDLWIADVGQDRFEEVTVLRAADGGGNGANLGWNQTEGNETYRSGVIPEDHVAPVITYAHGGRCSITGGEVYRGSVIPELYGTYIYGDFCSGEVFGYRVDESGSPVVLDVPKISQLSSFGRDNNGDVYALSRGGGVYRITG